MSSPVSVLALVLFLALGLQGAMLPCDDFGGPMNITNVMTNTPFDCSSPLVFDDFVKVTTSGTNNPITLANVFHDPAQQLLVLNFDPNMVALTQPQGQWLFFSIQGPLAGLGLMVGGVNSTVFEVACDSPIGPANPVCSASDVLASMIAFSPPFSNVDMTLLSRDPTNGITYIGKNLFTGHNFPNQTGGELSQMTQGFSYAVPEPASMGLMGLGLGLGSWIYRRRRVRA